MIPTADVDLLVAELRREALVHRDLASAFFRKVDIATHETACRFNTELADRLAAMNSRSAG